MSEWFEQVGTDLITVNADSEEQAAVKIQNKAKRLAERRAKLQAVAALPDLPEPREHTYANPNIVRGFGDYWLVTAEDGGKTSSGGVFTIKTATRCVVSWHTSQAQAEAWLTEHFGEKKSRYNFYIRSDDRTWRGPLYVRTHRKNPPGSRRKALAA